MTQQTQGPKAPVTKPIPVLAVVLPVVVVLALGGLLLFGRGMSSRVFQIDQRPAKPDGGGAAGAVEQPSGPIPTVRMDATASGAMIQAGKGGRFELAGLQFLIIHFGPQWRGVDQGWGITAVDGATSDNTALSDMQARWSVSGGQFDCHQTLKRTGTDTYTYDAALTSEAGVQTSLLVMEIHLPVVQYAGEQLVVDGAAVKLPETFATQGVFDSPSFRKLELATSMGRLVIEGSGPLWVQDNRQYGASAFTVRLPFAPNSGLLKQTELHMKMKLVP